MFDLWVLHTANRVEWYTTCSTIYYVIQNHLLTIQLKSKTASDLPIIRKGSSQNDPRGSMKTVQPGIASHWDVLRVCWWTKLWILKGWAQNSLSDPFWKQRHIRQLKRISPDLTCFATGIYLGSFDNLTTSLLKKHFFSSPSQVVCLL